jgi:hypothetical protein
VIGSYGTGLRPVAIAIDPSGKFAYVANSASANVSAFVIDGTSGALTPIPGSPFAAGLNPVAVGIVSGTASVGFSKFKVSVNIDQDRRTSFRAMGFFTLGDGSNGIDAESEAVQLQVGSYTVTLPAGSFRDHERHDFDHDRDRDHGRDRDHDRWKNNEFKFNGEINDVDLRILIDHVKGNDYLFTAEGRGHILQGIKNPVTVGLTIGDEGGSATVKADIDR